MGLRRRTPPILPDCADAVRVFLLSDTQWRTDGLGGVIDLDYAAAESAARAGGVAWSENLLLQLRVLGGVAAQALRRAAE